MGTRALIPWLSLRVYFKAVENRAGINHNKSLGQANEMHHPELSLRHGLKTPVCFGNSQGTGQSSK